MECNKDVRCVCDVSNENKNDVFRSASNTTRDFPGRICHRYLLNSRGLYMTQTFGNWYVRTYITVPFVSAFVKTRCVKTFQVIN
jgi:hypothetical protein